MLFFFKVIIIELLDGDKCDWFAISILILFLMIQCVPDPVQAFYWFNGSLYYLGFFSLLLYMIGICVQISCQEERKKIVRIRRVVMTVVLSAIIGGGNYVGTLLAVSYTHLDVYKRQAESRTGLGVKSEGQLIISGTRGYIKVTAPWWKTQEFEVCYEDTSQNERYFVKFLGDGLRYEISDFVSAMNGFEKSDYKLTAEESIAIAGIMEEFLTMRNSKGETEDEGL